MAGKTEFHFVTGGVDAALQHAAEAANGKDIRIGVVVATIQQFLRARLIDEVHLAISPILLGSGEQLFANIDIVKLGYRRTEHASTEKATHVVLSKESKLQSGPTERPHPYIKSRLTTTQSRHPTELRHGNPSGLHSELST
jgi:dihydrofolate reductase